MLLLLIGVRLGSLGKAVNAVGPNQFTFMDDSSPWSTGVGDAVTKHSWSYDMSQKEARLSS